ncbi:TetR/AcrR family transcriptional regulator [Mycobacteroides abscessus]|uniref:TetR/AcrR family transcriptional regulator n=1 Tax=Mycobacteroides abscessus TaxID=36809 RepID=UPI0009A62FAA|nr:TetR/AcrR family transcriptional regulator [Mycobacteroides abscessus]RIT42427.1 TetR/AcrR family transcriptional regulator [Mycobacteroides abscessus]SKT99882.1 putative TetR family transcriptional regulator [Mycobacteroides abscessus subsp. massiliense]SKU19278.1 putative TetR family transcriptional regulator [Mycobacteroides abscessus subsp. massiliense]
MTKAGDAKRSSLLADATNMASVEGLTGLSFGLFSERTRVSKSTLQTLFGSKEDLQLAILNKAVDVFTEVVMQPAESTRLGLPRLRMLMTNWLDYLGAFDGGCIFISAASELDGRPGPVRDALVRAIQAYNRVMAQNIELAVRLGELPSDTDVAQLTFELRAIVTQANQDVQLLCSPHALPYARAAIDRLLPTVAA